MAKQQSPILVGVFENFAQAQQACNELRSARFGDDYIGLADPGGSNVKTDARTPFFDIAPGTQESQS
jgi:hypothetical protein